MFIVGHPQGSPATAIKSEAIHSGCGVYSLQLMIGVNSPSIGTGFSRKC